MAKKKAVAKSHSRTTRQSVSWKRLKEEADERIEELQHEVFLCKREKHDIQATWDGVECRRAAIELQLNETAFYVQMALNAKTVEEKDDFLKKAVAAFRRPPHIAEQERAAAEKCKDRSAHPMLGTLIRENMQLREMVKAVAEC